MTKKKFKLPHEYATNVKETPMPDGDPFVTANLGGMGIGFKLNEIKNYHYKPSKKELYEV